MAIIRKKLSDFIGGWFIGNFEPSLLKSTEFEVSVKLHPKGEKWPRHYHKEATEYNCVVQGKVRIDGEVYEQDDIFVVPANTWVDPEFLEDCRIVCVKSPCVPGDKYEV